MQSEVRLRGTRRASTDLQGEGIHTGGTWEEHHLITAGQWDQKATVGFPATTSRACAGAAACAILLPSFSHPDGVHDTLAYCTRCEQS